jgi:hypothetical protein
MHLLPLSRIATGFLLIVAAFPRPWPLRQTSSSTFRSDVTLITLNVRVLDAHDHFVRGLASTHFQVWEDGVEQTIATFDAIDLPLPASIASDESAPATRSPQEREPSTQLQGRRYLFLLDDLHVSWATGATARRAVDQFMRRDLADGDVATVIVTSDEWRRMCCNKP